MSLFDIFKKNSKKDLEIGLETTKKSFFSKISHAIAGKDKIDISTLDDIEEALISSDISLDTTIKIIDNLEATIKKQKFISSSELFSILKNEIYTLLLENKSNDLNSFLPIINTSPYVIMVVGVNGVGKTTTIGKLAHQFSSLGKKVTLGAADTFRAAAVNQLKIWAERSNSNFVEKGQDADPSAVVFDTLKSALAKESDIVIIDTAGRLHNKLGLMNELSKIKSVMQKVVPNSPHEVLLVLDASTGQNAINQAREFISATEVNALALTKLDGTAKGGIVISLSDIFKIPIKYIGVGEQIHQLQPFNGKDFVDSLID